MRIQKIILALVAATFGLVGLSACSSLSAGGSTDRVSPQGYVTHAASSDMFEIESSRLALQRSQNPQIRAYAQAMIDGHTMSANDLKQTIQANNIPVAIPADQGILLPTHRYALRSLEQSNDFDRDYVNAQITAHNNAVNLHQTYADNGNNVFLIQNAINVLPHVVMHRNEAIQMSNAMKQGAWYTGLYPWNYGW